MARLLCTTLMVLTAIVGQLAYAQDVNLILVRHGESEFNLQKRFAGWSNTPLTEKGKMQATEAGNALKQGDYHIDVVHTSLLSRAVDTARLTSSAMGVQVPQHHYWRLNERSYGDLEGKTHEEMVSKVGEEQVKIWRRSFDVPPPPMANTDPRSPTQQPAYRYIDERVLPNGESLKDVIARIEPYWTDTLRPTLLSGKSVMVVGHSNALKALSVWADTSIEPTSATTLEVPNATPIVYRINIDNGKITIIDKKILGNANH